MQSYRTYAGDGEFPNAGLCSNSFVNLPVYPGLKEKKYAGITNLLNTFE
jgi:dTDP-4-amino-4,6-dideoxygalactose transaminase